jgi:catechol 2,3-dioxygenase-like lactoylglutathione lyase family enzyme
MFRQLQQRVNVISIFVLILLLIVGFRLFQPRHVSAKSSSTPSFLLHHITLSVSDAEQVSRWYADILGFMISDRFTLTRPNGSQIDVIRIEVPGLRMNISRFDDSVVPNRTSENQGWRHIAFEVDDVDRQYQLLQSRGVQFLGEPLTYDPPGYRIAFFRDPEGNILELYQDL